MGLEKRKYERFDTELKIYFQVNYELKTKVEFQLVDRKRGEVLPQKYFAISKNVGAQGLCFTSGKKLDAGDRLFIEIYLPSQERIPMEGEVRWCKEADKNGHTAGSFDTGIKLLKVNEKLVESSIRFDEENKIVWSEVLETVFGSFRVFAEKERLKK